MVATSALWAKWPLAPSRGDADGSWSMVDGRNHRFSLIYTHMKL